MENYDKVINRIKKIPLSRNTVKDRILELTNNVKRQLYLNLSSVKVFLISLDETTDITSKSRLATIARYSDGIKMREDLVELENLSNKTTGVEICRVVNQVFVDNKIDIRKIVSIATDGEQNMVGKLTGFKKNYLQIKSDIQWYLSIALYTKKYCVPSQVLFVLMKLWKL
jgi:hypothetical protein